jgi:hypothetical protein
VLAEIRDRDLEKSDRPARKPSALQHNEEGPTIGRQPLAAGR